MDLSLSSSSGIDALFLTVRLIRERGGIVDPRSVFSLEWSRSNYNVFFYLKFKICLMVVVMLMMLTDIILLEVSPDDFFRCA